MTKPISASARPTPPPPGGEEVPMDDRSWFRRNALAIAITTACVLATTVFFLAIPVVFSDKGFIRKADIGKSEWESVDTDQQYDIAIHEAGHVIVNAIVRPDRGFDQVYIKTSKRKDSSTLGMTEFAPSVAGEETLETLDGDTLVDYAGEIAEEALLGDKPYTESSDYKHANSNLYERVTKLCDRKHTCKLLTDKDGRPKKMNVVVAELETKSRERAKKFIEANKDAIIRLANKIMLQPEENRRRTLSAIEITVFLANEKLVNPEEKKKEASSNEQCAEDPNQLVPGVSGQDAGLGGWLSP